MNTLYLILLIVSAVCFALAALFAFRPSAGAAKVNLIALGLLAWVLVPLIQTARSL